MDNATVSTGEALEHANEEIARLREEVAELRSQLNALRKPAATGTAGAAAVPAGKRDMSDAGAEDEDNPYSRLLALKRMGVVRNYEAVRTFTVAVVGMGGVGSVAAEMLARCGLGRLCLFDQDRVAVANMNRLFYRPEHVGQSKVAAAAAVLHAINPDVALEAHACDVTTVAGYEALCACLRGGVDLVLSCVDNYQARLTINAACCERGVAWLESGVAENALGGHVQLMLPGRTACFQCAPPLLVASEISEATLRRDGVCAASLPTTMGLVAALLAQAALKHLLGFAPVSCFLGYNAFSDYFPRDVLRPNPECPNAACRARQRECRANGTALPPGYDPVDAALRARREQDARDAAQQRAAAPNEWGIVCVDDDDDNNNADTSSAAPVNAGSKASPTLATETVHTDPAATVEDLAALLQAAQSP